MPRPAEPQTTANPLAERDDWYRRPAWYDILHTPGTAREVSGLERIARRFCSGAARSGRRRAHWLEPATGTARYLRTAARRGYTVTGFDNLIEMVDYARRRMRALALPRSRWQVLHADMTDFTIARPADFAFCLINTARHLMSDRAMLDHLHCVARALRPGGVYALGINTAHPGLDFDAEDVWAAARGPCKVTQVVQYLPPPNRPLQPRSAPPDRVERVISHLTIATPSGTRYLDSAYDLRTYTLGQWRALIARSPMRALGAVDEEARDLAVTDDLGPTAAPPGGYAVHVLTPR